MTEQTAKTDFIAILTRAVERRAIRKVTFSRPEKNVEATRVCGRMIRARGGDALLCEYTIGVTVRQETVPADGIPDVIRRLCGDYRQGNLSTSVGDAEFRRNTKNSILIGGDALRAALENVTPGDTALPGNDRTKNRMLSGGEDFLIELGISDRNGRVHDKRQAKFRQIERFLDHLKTVYPHLRRTGKIRVCDLCCGKSYLSFAVYYYLTALCGREVDMVCVDRRGDVMDECRAIGERVGYTGMRFITGDVNDVPFDDAPDLVVSLHACDVATDVVLARAVALHAKVILATPCCHRHLQKHIACAPLAFVTAYPHLSDKLCESLTDALRVAYLRAAGYSVTAPELTDPDDTPKNTLIRAVRSPVTPAEQKKREAAYAAALDFLLGDKKEGYLAIYERNTSD